jgi:NAD(P)-dependent dehydrogenase (short-subunit alcohol dehydrogenase family)
MTGKNKRIGLITGAKKGIGFEAARQLATSGCVILLGARSQTLGKGAAERLAAEPLDVRYIPIDLDDPVTIKAAGSMIDRDFGHLDILINNAGIAVEGDGPPSTSSLEAIERRCSLVSNTPVKTELFSNAVDQIRNSSGKR